MRSFFSKKKTVESVKVVSPKVDDKKEDAIQLRERVINYALSRRPGYQYKYQADGSLHPAVMDSSQAFRELVASVSTSENAKDKFTELVREQLNGVDHHTLRKSCEAMYDLLTGPATSQFLALQKIAYLYFKDNGKLDAAERQKADLYYALMQAMWACNASEVINKHFDSMRSTVNQDERDRFLSQLYERCFEFNNMDVFLHVLSQEKNADFCMGKTMHKNQIPLLARVMFDLELSTRKLAWMAPNLTMMNREDHSATERVLSELKSGYQSTLIKAVKIIGTLLDMKASVDNECIVDSYSSTELDKLVYLENSTPRKLAEAFLARVKDHGILSDDQKKTLTDTFQRLIDAPVHQPKMNKR